jgi:hypothetical protein
VTDRERLLQTLAATFAYYERELTEFICTVWLEDLEGQPIDAVCEAFVRHRRDPERGQWMPKTADILRQLRGDADEAAAVAWRRVLAAAKRGGGAFDGPEQQALEAIGGMRRLRLAQESETGHLRREFASAFAAFRAREDRGTSPLLSGEQALRLQ